MNILIDNLLMQLFYIQNHKTCLNKKILYQYYVVFVLLETTSLLKYYNSYVIRQHQAKNVKEKTTKCSLKTTEVLLDTNGHKLKCHIYQGTGITNYFKCHTKSCPHFFQENGLSDIRSEIHYRTICLNLQKLYSGLRHSHEFKRVSWVKKSSITSITKY